MGGAFGASIDGAATQDVEAHGAVALRPLADGKMPVKCVPGRLTMARLRPDAFPGGNPWQFFHSMYPKRGLGREKGGASWQDSRAMHPKSPANRRRRIHRAKILPGRGPFRCTDPSNHARRADLAIRRRRTTLAPATSVPPNSAKPPERPQPRRRRTARNSASRPQPRRRPHGSAPPTAFAVPAAATPQTLPHPTAPRH